MDIAYKLGAGRYIQMPGAIEKSGQEIARYGQNILILGGPRAISILKQDLSRQLKQNNLKYQFLEYDGYTTWQAADHFSEYALEHGFDVIAGIGGGRIMDLSKAVAHKAQLPVVTIPTSSATCAAYTPMSVMYEENGKALGTKNGNFYHDYEVNSIIIDEQIMVQQPPRYAAAGMLDSMAKVVEIRNGHPEVQKENMSFELYTAYLLSQYIYDELKHNYQKIYIDIEEHRISKEVHDYLYINFALTGFISGSSKALGQTALAHEMYYAVRKYFTIEGLGFLHGEIVGTSLILQLAYNRQENQIPEFVDFMKKMQMPVRLQELGVPETEKNKEIIYQYLLQTSFVEKSKENLEYLRKSIECICGRR